MVQATATAPQTVNNLEDYYAYIQANGALRTPTHARHWSRATLNMLGVNVSRSTKKALANALPDELKADLTKVFWLAHFRDTNLSAYDFQNRVARRAGNTDAQFARIPVTAVFSALKQLAPQDIGRQVADDLSPELRAIWEKA
ncbi:MAG: DUF2267 domain-containing protein [Anaerolineales bacterium]|nr:DUF2267 domain-containing protein [Anaerolineales bacterium]